MKMSRRAFALSAASAAGAGTLGLGARPAAAKTAQEINSGVDAARRELFNTVPGAQNLYNRSAGVLIMPEIIEAGLIIGGAYGEGALITNGRISSYWAYGSASLGFQLGGQVTRQALFFLTNQALLTFQNSSGFELGVDAEVTIIDQGGGAGLDTTKDTKPVMAIEFGRRGLLGGATLQGGKYTPLVR